MLPTVFLVLAMVMAGVGKASPEPVVRVEPAESTAAPGETFSVNITVTDIVIIEEPPQNGLFAWEAWITFDPNVLHAVNETTTEGPFLKSAGYPTLWRSSINNTKGTVTVGAWIHEYPYPPNGSIGSGVLATLTFEVMSQGQTSLHFEKPALQARTNLYTIVTNNRVDIPFTAEDGSFDNRGFVFPTEIVIAVVVVVVVVLAAAVFFYRRRT